MRLVGDPEIQRQRQQVFLEKRGPPTSSKTARDRVVFSVAMDLQPARGVPYFLDKVPRSWVLLEYGKEEGLTSSFSLICLRTRPNCFFFACNPVGTVKYSTRWYSFCERYAICDLRFAMNELSDDGPDQWHTSLV